VQRRFSTRLPWDTPANPFTQLREQAAALHISPINLIDLNPLSQLPLVHTPDLLRSFSSARALTYTPTPQGDLGMRQTIAAYYEQRGYHVRPRDIVLCSSSSEGYQWLFQLLANPGETVLFPEPGYPLLSILANLAGVRSTSYPIRRLHRYQIFVQEIAGALTDDTRAVVAVSPNSPTGNFFRETDCERLVELLTVRQIPLISDEVANDYVLEDPYPAEGRRIFSIADGLDSPFQDAPFLRFILSGCSKVLGLPQIKLGWIVVLGPEPLRTEAQNRLELIADMFLSVSAPTQHGTPPLFSMRSELFGRMFSRIQESYRMLRHWAEHAPVTLASVEGGFTAVLRLPNIMDEDEWLKELLLKEELIVHPGYFYDLADGPNIVLSLLTNQTSLQEGLARLGARLDMLCPHTP
jgi:aspartate/methionine/tyrosine aminotransferase